MDKESKPGYAYDPFGTDSNKRWGRKGTGKDVPDIPGYEIIDLLGSGGMASVWSAKHIALNQARAVKVLDRSLSEDPGFVARFSQEAKALGRLQHPNIVRVFDASAETSPAFIAMQWVEGDSLTANLKRRKVPLEEAMMYFEQVAAALDYAHSLGFVHRDIKPSNVMITEGGEAMLIDFGVADFLGADQLAGRTLTGTTRYLSPEVIAGRMATKSSDLWAFAVLMYRVLTGSMPFDGSSSEAILKSITSDPPGRPENVSPKMSAFLIQALQKDPSKRFKSAGEMVAALKDAAKLWTPKVKKEGLAVGTAFGLFAIVAAAAVMGGVALLYRAMHQPSIVARLGDRATKAGTAAGLGPNKYVAPPSAATVLPAVADMKGVWYGDLGTKWAEARLEPSGGRKFHLVLAVRDDTGMNPITASGELGSDGQSVTYSEDGAVATGFSGTISADHSQLQGAWNGNPVKFSRAADVAMTTLPLTQDGVSIGYPSGWKPSESSDATGHTVTISPIGRADVFVRILTGPAGGKNAGQILQEREQQLASDAVYKQLSVNQDASLGGQRALSWDFRDQKVGGALMHGTVFAVPRGDNITIVEFWNPVVEDDVWTPLAESMRRSTQIAAPPAQ